MQELFLLATEGDGVNFPQGRVRERDSHHVHLLVVDVDVAFDLP